MTHQDELLQEQIAMLEAGLPLESVADGAPGSGDRHTELLALVDSLRGLPQPVLDPLAARRMDQAIRQAIEARNGSHSPAGQGKMVGRLRLPRLFPKPALAGIGALLVFVAAGLWALSLGRFSAGANLLTATTIAGEVLVSAADAPGGWKPLLPGDPLEAGQSIRTGHHSAASLTFANDSQTLVRANSELTIRSLEASADGSLRIELSQPEGQTTHHVTSLKGTDGAFLVQTPSGTSSVQGTVFSVSVAESGESDVAVSEGRVVVSSSGEDVVLQAGQTTRTAAGQPPAAPLAMAEQQLPSLSFEPDELETSGCAGSFAFDGTLVNDGTMEAADIELGYEVIKGAELVGSVTVSPSSWGTLGPGVTTNFMVEILLNAAWQTVSDETEVKVRLFIAQETNRPDGHPARLTLTGTLDCDMETVTPSPTATVTATATLTPTPPLTPTLTVTPTLSITPTAVTPTPAGTVTTVCTGADPHPQGVALAQKYGVTYEEIMGWFCMRFGFGEIDLAYSIGLEAGITVEEVFAMRQSGMGWGQIQQELGLLPGGPPSTPPGNGNGQTGGGPPATPPGNGDGPPGGWPPGGGPPVTPPGGGPPGGKPDK